MRAEPDSSSSSSLSGRPTNIPCLIPGVSSIDLRYRHTRGNCTMAVWKVFVRLWKRGVKKAGSAKMRDASMSPSGSDFT